MPKETNKKYKISSTSKDFKHSCIDKIKIIVDSEEKTPSGLYDLPTNEKKLSQEEYFDLTKQTKGPCGDNFSSNCQKRQN